jgi:hypothetical protein
MIYLTPTSFMAFKFDFNFLIQSPTVGFSNLKIHCNLRRCKILFYFAFICKNQKDFEMGNQTKPNHKRTERERERERESERERDTEYPV